MRKAARVISLWAIAAAIAFLLAFALTEQATRPYREFQLTIDGITYRGYGTEIHNTGFCSELIKDGMVTTIICKPHMIVEVYNGAGPGRLPLETPKHQID